jgi:hypothetical protein
VYYILTEFAPSNVDLIRYEREDVVWPRLREAGAVPLALWRVIAGGPPDQVLELVRYDSLTHWSDTTGQFTSHRGGTRPSLVSALKPASRRHPGGEPVEARPENLWALRWMRCLPTQYPRMVEISEDTFWASTQHTDRQVTLGMMLAIGAQHRDIMMLTRYESITDWESTREGRAPAARSEEERQRAQKALHDRNLLVADQGVRLLAPISRIGPDRSTIIEVGGGR